MPSYEEQVRREMEATAKEQQCPVEEDIDAPLSIKRTLRKIGAKVGLVKHPSKQTIGDIKRGKVGESEGGRSGKPKRSK